MTSCTAMDEETATARCKLSTVLKIFGMLIYQGDASCRLDEAEQSALIMWNARRHAPWWNQNTLRLKQQTETELLSHFSSLSNMGKEEYTRTAVLLLVAVVFAVERSKRAVERARGEQQRRQMMAESERHAMSTEKWIEEANSRELKKLDRCITPTCGMQSMVLTTNVKASLESIIHYTKAHSVMFEKWGFDNGHRASKGISSLFVGAPGTGKTMAAE